MVKVTGLSDDKLYRKRVFIKIFNMKSIRVLAILFSLFFLIPTGCKKYEDGPWFSIYTRKERVTANWRFDLVKVDGVDKTEEYADQSIEIMGDGDLGWIQGYEDDNPRDWYGIGGTWEFAESDTKLKMHFTEHVDEEFTWVWTIQRLAYGDLRMKRYDDENRKIEWRLWSR